MGLLTSIIIASIIVLAAPVVFFFLRREYKRQQSLLQELAELRRAQEATSRTRGQGPAQSSSEVPTRVTAEPERRHVLVSYSHKDAQFVQELMIHLAPVLRRQEVFQWAADQVEVNRRRSERLELIAKSSVAIAVVSPDYLVLDDGRELAALIEAHKKAGLGLVWLPVRPSAVETTDLANYQGLLNPGKPLSTLNDAEREIALVRVAEAMARYLDRLEGQKGEGAESRVASTAAPTYRLQSVRLRNIRCFEDITLDLYATPLLGGQRLPSLRTVLVGDNAMGKSTLLRSVALGMCNESGATALLSKMPGRLIRSGAKSGRIELRFVSEEPNAGSLAVVTELELSQAETEVVRKSGDPPPNITIVGYGTQRTKRGTESYESYDVAAAVATLFDDKANLQNPELVLLRQPRWTRRGIEAIVAGILNFDSDRVEYRNDAFRITGPWGQERIEVLSDGYRSTTQWVLDFINWLVFSGNATSPPDELAAIVLIDELEQHLHPQWQRKIISRLRKHLPKVQFLITSHSPLIASSITGLDQNEWREKLVHFGADDHGKVTATDSESLRGLNVQQALASRMFDYLVDTDPSVAETFAEASRLASKGSDRTPDEQEKYKKVKRIVGEILVNQDVTPIEREARKDLHEETQTKIRKLEEELFGEKR